MINWADIDTSNWLFRYRSFDPEEKNVDALKSRRLYFSAPAWFNDPYDSLVFANASKIWGEMYGNICKGMDDYLEKTKSKSPVESFVAYHMWNNDRDKALELTFQMFHNCLKKVRNQIRYNSRIICLSQKYDSLLMWSHYADYHKGFLLAYDTNELRNSTVYSKEGHIVCNSIRVDPVQYVTKQLDLTDEVGWYVRENVMPGDSVYVPQDKSVGVTKVRRVLLEKAVDWSYEYEWRVTERRPEFNMPSLASYIECCPKAIIVGSKSDEKKHKEMIKISGELDIPLFRMYLSENENGFLLLPEDGSTFYCF